MVQYSTTASEVSEDSYPSAKRLALKGLLRRLALQGVSTRHLFGAGSFDAVETFDTLIKCDLSPSALRGGACVDPFLCSGENSTQNYVGNKKCGC